MHICACDFANSYGWVCLLCAVCLNKKTGCLLGWTQQVFSERLSEWTSGGLFFYSNIIYDSVLWEIGFWIWLPRERHIVSSGRAVFLDCVTSGRECENICGGVFACLRPFCCASAVFSVPKESFWFFTGVLAHHLLKYQASRVLVVGPMGKTEGTV